MSAGAKMFMVREDTLNKAIDMWHYQADNKIGLYSEDLDPRKGVEIIGGNKSSDILRYYVNQVQLTELAI